MHTAIYYPANYQPTRSGPLAFDGVTFLPSKPTFLSDAQVAKLNGNSSFLQCIEWGAIKITSEAIADTPQISKGIEVSTKLPETLEDYNIKGDGDELGAEDLIELTEDLEVLRRWLASEERVTLQKSISNRIDELTD